MKKTFLLTSILVSVLSLTSLQAQPKSRGGGGMFGGAPGTQFGGAMNKIFGDHKFFSADLQTEMVDAAGKSEISVPAKMLFLEGKSRVELDLAQAKGSSIKPEMAAQIQMMGMSEMTAISRPDKKLSYLVYPGLKSYAEMTMTEAEAGTDDSKMKVDVKADGSETVDGHDCLRNKVTITDADGKAREFTVWNAKDLKKFPVKIETNEGGRATKMLFKAVKFDKPDAGKFEAPKDYERYDNVQAMMQGAMMKKFGGGAGAPPK